MDWRYFVLGLIAFQILKMLYHALDHELRERRQKRFLRAVRVIYPDSQLLFSAVDTSDRKTMAKLKEQIENGKYAHYVKVDENDGDEDCNRDR